MAKKVVATLKTSTGKSFAKVIRVQKNLKKQKIMKENCSLMNMKTLDYI